MKILKLALVRTWSNQLASIPDFQYTKLYYPDILAALLIAKSEEWPEHTETDPHDPVVQILRNNALVGHGGSVRLDHAALENYITVMKLRGSMIAKTALIDYLFAPPSPATADLVAEVTGSAAPGTVIVRAKSRFSTGGTAEDPPIVYEYDVVEDLETTIALGAYGFGSYTASTGVPQTVDIIQDHTGSELTATLFGPSGLVPSVNRGALIWWHPELQFDKITPNMTIAGAGIAGIRWEYYDDSRIAVPSGPAAAAIVDLGGTIRIDVTDLVGDTTDSTGLDVLVTCLLTGEQEWLQTTVLSSTQIITTTGTLGQTVVSANAADYLVQTFWPELPGLVDETAELTATAGDVTWNLPQTTERRWASTTLTDLAGVAITGLIVRARIYLVGGTAPPTFDAAGEPSETTWSVLVPITQGQTYIDRLGVTDGSPSQKFTLSRTTPLITVEQVLLTDGEWERVDNFLSSTTFDRVYTLIEQADGSQELTFGNGLTGKIPPTSSTVDLTARYGGVQSGNVGPDSITTSRSGNSKLRNPRNPREATGWVVQEGTTALSLETTRAAAPASIRTLGKAVTPGDMEVLALAYRTEDGRQIAERALAIQEGFGPKTVKLVVAGPGGIAPTQADLDELDVYFNGVIVGLQRVGGVMLSNTLLTAVAYTPSITNITATVSVLSAYAAGAKERIEAALGAQIRPSARRLVLDEDGVWQESLDFLWDFGGTVSTAFILTTIVTAISGVTNVLLTVPASDISLGAEALPVNGTFLITVVVV